MPVAALFSPPGFVAVTDVQLTPEAVARVRREGQPEADRLAQQIAAQLPSMILASCRTTKPQHKPDGRGKPRRSRQQVLAGIAEANRMRSEAQARRQPAGGPQGREQNNIGGLPGANAGSLTAE